MSSHQSDKDTLASTACWVAAVRAHESKRADRLFNDPWAALLAGEEGEAWRERSTGGDETKEVGLVIRTRFFDDFLIHVTREHAIPQLIILAAGMDTRAFRLPWPQQTHLFELDQPQIFERKEPLLATAGAVPACQRQIVGVDLGGSWVDPLLRAGFDPGQRSVWLMEGLLFYLPADLVTHLFEGVTALSLAGSWLGCELHNSEMLTSPWTRPWIEMLAQHGAPWISSIDDPAAFLAEHGWSATVTLPGEDGAHFGRWPFPVIPREVSGMPRTFFVTATRNPSAR
ncbi:MAG TPA: SAM-dependent methyltransferase [Ktedonosporobacter sp.]|nr:SAM-dependent methyltransferase [Ktedonosporobacter sp.]